MRSQIDADIRNMVSVLGSNPFQSLLLIFPNKSQIPELSRIYRELARKFHPDMNPGDPTVAQKFNAIQAFFDDANHAFSAGLADEEPGGAPRRTTPYTGPIQPRGTSAAQTKNRFQDGRKLRPDDIQGIIDELKRRQQELGMDFERMEQEVADIITKIDDQLINGYVVGSTRYLGRIRPEDCGREDLKTLKRLLKGYRSQLDRGEM